jgi:hypothetical protein
VVLLELKYACYGWFQVENLNGISHKLKVIIVTSSISDEDRKTMTYPLFMVILINPSKV